MYQLSDTEIDFIVADIRQRGITVNSLCDDLVDHVCCILEDEIKQPSEFESTYLNVIQRFYKNELTEVQTETQLLLTLKHYYTMKKIMITSGTAATALLTTGLVFKFLHWAGAGILILLGAVILTFLFLPIVFTLKIKEKKATREKVVLGIGMIISLGFCLYPMFKVFHWPGANMIGSVTLGILIVAFLPIYFITGIRNPDTKTNTIVTSVMIVSIASFFLVLIRSPYSSQRIRVRETGVFLRNEDILKNEEALFLKNNKLNADADNVYRLCNELKSFILESENGVNVINEQFEENSLFIPNGLTENFINFKDGKKKIESLTKAIDSYNISIEKKGGRKISLTLTALDKEAPSIDHADKLMNDIFQIQMMVIQNERLSTTIAEN